MDFRKQLEKQLRFLKTSCDMYDAGDKDEAIRIATVIRTVFHTTKNSTSLLMHLKSQHIELLSVCEKIPDGAKFWPNLTVLKLSPIEGWAEYTPKLHTARTKRLVSLNQWWRYETVYLLGSMLVSRRDLVLSAVNKDGGAHVDAKLNAEYEEVMNGVGWKMTLNLPSEDKDIPFRNAHLAAIRQIGYEALNSPDLLKLALSATDAGKV